MKHHHEHELLQSITKEGWNIVGVRQHHGIAVFLNSLHSSSSGGIGEFLDLLPLIDWCQSIGMDVIQLLPLNDNCLDPSPYNGISACALNPIFLKLAALPHLEEYPDLKDRLSTLYSFNALPRIPYVDVLKGKMVWLREYFERIFPQMGNEPSFQHYRSAYPWVETYALFKALHLKFDHAPWEKWPAEFQNLTPPRRTELIEEYKKEIAFHTFLQFLCFEQLSNVREYAEQHRVFLKGDLPILISRNSSDVWHTPHFFDLSHTAGAPPDQYSQEGQNWGFPLFNWEAMRQEDYLFWRERLRYATHFYHLYRIDHAVGFFRIWGIPLGRPSKEGRFIPEESHKYLEQGALLLSMLAASSPMLPIAEDLGSVPPEVRTSLTHMGIPGTRVMRWEVDWHKKTDGHPFLPFNHYPPISMTCVSTHDSETLEGWWKNDPVQATVLAKTKHWHYTPELSYEHRKAILKDSHHTSSLFHINLLQEYLALYPDMIAETPEEERINIPGTILPTNWTYRYRPSLETIVSHKELLSTIRSLVKS